MRRRTSHIIIAAVIAGLSAGCFDGGGSQPDVFKMSDTPHAGTSLRVRDGMGAVVVRHSADNALHISGGLTWHGRRQDVHFTTVNAGDDVYVCAMWKDSGRCGPSGYHAPSNFHLLAFLSLFHRSGNTQANFTIELPDSVSIDVSNAEGAVVLSGVTSAVSAHVTNGALTDDDIVGPFSAKIVNGVMRIGLRAGANADSLHVEAVNGAIHATLPSNVQGAFDLSATNGGVKIGSLALTPNQGRHRRYTGQLGTSTRPVYMHVVNGAVGVTTVGSSAPSRTAAVAAPAAPRR